MAKGWIVTDQDGNVMAMTVRLGWLRQIQVSMVFHSHSEAQDFIDYRVPRNLRRRCVISQVSELATC